MPQLTAELLNSLRGEVGLRISSFMPVGLLYSAASAGGVFLESVFLGLALLLVDLEALDFAVVFSAVVDFAALVLVELAWVVFRLVVSWGPDSSDVSDSVTVSEGTSTT
jgi:hypothetical protein